MNAAIQQRARELGFDTCRITRAAPPQTAAFFTRWLTKQRHGTMSYLERTAHKRIAPQQVLPGARSIITLAVSYAETSRIREPAQPGPAVTPPAATGAPQPPVNLQHSAFGIRPPTGVIARYARFADYHSVLAEPLRTLAQYLDQLGGSGTRSLWYVDTGPLLERDLAQRAGSGFVGKHTNLISRQLGNWILLGEIITTLELEPDRPEKNRCGSCTRCLAACPTAAITAPFQLDARRCISYLTIELRDAIPVGLRPAIGNRIFGCDDCLAVCPWNRFAQEGKLMKAHARADLGAPDLVELLSLDDAEFKRRFAGTPMLRAKRRGLLRNVCVALGNVGDARALPALQRASADCEPLIAEHARWALKRIRTRLGDHADP
ncbi:MAG: tRNA epoxyqueuosine(34) reductase QueG [Limisphaerales bacterium]